MGNCPRSITGFHLWGPFTQGCYYCGAALQSRAQALEEIRLANDRDNDRATIAADLDVAAYCERIKRAADLEAIRLGVTQPLPATKALKISRADIERAALLDLNGKPHKPELRDGLINSINRQFDHKGRPMTYWGGLSVAPDPTECGLSAWLKSNQRRTA